jgi:sortase B
VRALKLRKIILALFLVIFLAIAAVSGYQLYSIRAEYQKGEDSYEALDAYITLPDTGDTESQPAQETEVAVQDEDGETRQLEVIQWPEVDFDGLQAINPDIVGWIYIADTQISYPVVQASDNSYYLKRMVDGGHNSAGSIFMDYRNDSNLTDRNSILYGHHMKNGSMFAGLVKYKTSGYYEEHPRALLMTPEKNYVIDFFSGYVASEDMDAWQVAFADDVSYAQWLKEAQSRSCFQSSVEVDSSCQVVTLSTCSYEFENARFVLVGILRGEDELWIN